jgi:hypothetical protein
VRWRKTDESQKIKDAHFPLPRFHLLAFDVQLYRFTSPELLYVLSP